jgi:hypothetical protein
MGREKRSNNAYLFNAIIHHHSHCRFIMFHALLSLSPSFFFFHNLFIIILPLLTPSCIERLLTYKLDKNINERFNAI